MDQKKTGEFLKHMRKDRELTQEQLAEHFNVSSRTISRWETGSNMPDVNMLIELADFYGVEIREILIGEKREQSMSQEAKDDLKEVAKYAAATSKKRESKVFIMLIVSIFLLEGCDILFAPYEKGWLNGIVPADICSWIMTFASTISIGTIILYTLHHWGIFNKIGQWKKQHAGKLS